MSSIKVHNVNADLNMQQLPKLKQLEMRNFVLLDPTSAGSLLQLKYIASVSWTSAIQNLCSNLLYSANQLEILELEIAVKDAQVSLIC